MSLRPVADALAGVLGKEVPFVGDCVGEAARQAVDGLADGDEGGVGRLDGVLLDLIIDYLTYVFIPAFALFQSGLLPGWTGWFAIIAATVSVMNASYLSCVIVLLLPR